MTTQQPRRIWTLILAGLGGFITDAAFPMRNLWFLAFFGIALLVVALRRDSARWSWVVGTTWGFGLFLPHLWWAYEAVGPIPWVALSALSAMMTGTAMALWAWVRRAPQLAQRPLLQAVILPLIWMCLEHARHYWPFGGFPWGRLAFSQTEGPLVRLAAIGGAPLVSAIVVLIGAFMATAVITLARKQAFPAIMAATIAAVLVAASFLVPFPVLTQTGTLKLGAVQGNVSQPGLHAFSNRIEVLTNHVEGTENLVAEVGQENLDLVVWPENASDINPRADDAARDLVNRASQAAGVPLLIGTDRNEDGERFNEMVLWEPGLEDTFAYAKQVPAAFAEYIPMRDIARKFSSAVDLVRTDMSAGTEVAVINTPIARLDRDVPIGIAICFEIAYDWVLREAVNEGAEFLVVPTNNASFGYTAESEQQLAMTKFRAVELGRASVQVSTVGVSGIITPNGQIIEETELFTADQMHAEVPLITGTTLAAKIGEWPTLFAAGISGIYLLLAIFGRARKKENKS